MSIDPKSLKLFASVIKHGTIAAAAENAHIAAAAVSRRMSDLEGLMGTELLMRSNKGIEATPAGLALLDLSHRVLNELDHIKLQMRDYAMGTKGHVRVFVNISAITQFMPNELSAFLAENPQIQIHLEEHVSTGIARAIIENNADVGVMTLDGHIEGVEMLPYQEDELVVVVPRSHPLAGKQTIKFEETIECDYVGLPAGSQVNRQLIRASRDLGKPWRNRFQVPSYDALCFMVESGLGIGLLPRRTAIKYANVFELWVATLDEPWAHRKIVICIRSYDALSPPARQLVDRMIRKDSSMRRGQESNP